MTEWVISASALTAAVIVLRLIFRKRIGRLMQYALWGIVLLRLLLPFSLFSSPISIANAFPADAPAEQAYSLPVSHEPAPEAQSSEGSAAESVAAKDRTIANDADSSGYAVLSDDGKTVTRYLARMSITDIHLLIWLAGGMAAGIWLLAANLIFRSRLKGSRIPFGIPGCKLKIFVSDRLASPCLFGLLRPAIYLTPAAAAGNIGHVLAHELCHYRHGDHIWAAARCLCMAVWWWNPLVWAAAFMSRTDGELACDEAAIRLLGEENRLAYGRTLVDMISEKRTASGLLCAATTMVYGKRGIKERLEMIIKHPKRLISAAIAVLITAALAAGCTFTGGDAASGKMPFKLSFSDIETVVYNYDSDAEGDPHKKTETLSQEDAEQIVTWFNESINAARTDKVNEGSEWLVVSFKGGGIVPIYRADDTHILFRRNEGEMYIAESAEIAAFILDKASGGNPSYSSFHFGENGSILMSMSPLPEEGARLAEELIMNAMLKSAVFKSVDLSQLLDGWAISQNFPNGETHQYYAFIIEDGPVTGAVLQSEPDGWYTRIDDALYQSFADYMINNSVDWSDGKASSPAEVDRTDPEEITKAFLAAYFDKLCDLNSDLEWDAESRTWLSGLIKYNGENQKDIALLSQWIEYIKYISEDGYNAERDMGRYSSFVNTTDIGERSGPNLPTVEGYFRTSAFGTPVHLWMDQDSKGNWSIVKIWFWDWKEYNNFCDSFTAYMEEHGYTDYSKSMYIDSLREKKQALAEKQ